MSDITFVPIRLEKLFKNKRGNSSLTRKYCKEHIGEYEVYTGTTIGSFAKIDTYEYDEPLLTYTTDGEYAGTVEYITVEKYNIGGHRAVLFPLDDRVCLEYFNYVLESVIKGKIKEGSVPSATWNIIKNLHIPVPIDENGEYDVIMQMDIARKYKILEEKKQTLIDYMHKLESCLIEADLTEKYRHKEFLISDLFEPERGSPQYTKKFCNMHRGIYPVYSSNTREIFFNIDSYDYDGEFITWSTDGFAGYIFVATGKFSATDHRGVLVPKPQTDIKNLDINYLKYVLEPVFRKNVKGRVGHNGQNEYTSLKLNAVKAITQKISIPVKEDGTFDLAAQREISKNYDKLYKVKSGVCDKINRLVSRQISLV